MKGRRGEESKERKKGCREEEKGTGWKGGGSLGVQASGVLGKLVSRV